MSLRNKDIISIRDLSKEEIEEILGKSKEMENVLNKGQQLDMMKGKVLANLFLSQAQGQDFLSQVLCRGLAEMS